MSFVSFGSFADEMQKIALRRGAKIVQQFMGGDTLKQSRRAIVRQARRDARKAQKLQTESKVLPQGGAVNFRAGAQPTMPEVSAQNWGKADRLAKTRGVIKPSPQGTQVMRVGRGGEGTATGVADTQFGMSVRKDYDTLGTSSKELQQRTAKAGKSVGDNPYVAKFHGQRRMPGGGTAQFSEWVPRGAVPMEGTRAQGQAIAKKRATEAAQKAGFDSPQDIRPANMVLDSRTGKYKVVDWIPTHADEVVPKTPEYLDQVRKALPPQVRANFDPDQLVSLTDKGQSTLVNPKYTEQLRKGNFDPKTPYREHIQSAMMTPAQRQAKAQAVEGRRIAIENAALKRRQQIGRAA